MIVEPQLKVLHENKIYFLFIHSVSAEPTKLSVLFFRLDLEKKIHHMIYCFCDFCIMEFAFSALFKLWVKSKSFQWSSGRMEIYFFAQLSPFISRNFMSSEWKRNIQTIVAGVSSGYASRRMSRTSGSKIMRVWKVFHYPSPGDVRFCIGRNIKCKFLA